MFPRSEAARDYKIRSSEYEDRESDSSIQPQSKVRNSCFASNYSFFKTLMSGLNIFSLYYLVKFYAKRGYIVFWHELSMDPAVRLSPWSPPVPNEKKLSKKLTIQIRTRRIAFLIIHVLGLMGISYCLAGKVLASTLLWTLFLGCMSSIAITAGSHRLWSHHSYKAKWPMRLILTIFHTVGFQFSILNWVKDHRVHHKYVDTDADPHNSKRGFFFSHMGWVLVQRHPEVAEKRDLLDLRDVESDWFVSFQNRYYFRLVLLFTYVIPTTVPWYFWGESVWISHVVASHMRHMITLHGTFMINSVAHMWGTKPYDKNICPTENMIVSVTSFGDGWHNYHHVFPWDYKNAELWDYKLNLSTLFVDICALIGWAYDLKTVPTEMVAKRVQRTGDGTHPLHHHHHERGVWGWTDKDLSEEDRVITHIINVKNR